MEDGGEGSGTLCDWGEQWELEGERGAVDWLDAGS